ncbi:MAG: 6-phosphofructokinase [Planctomycetota bacterium]|nr:6-phosphofructokinase [Planctomycetota bacterium]MDA1250442.1 6-phosphofructokinase [Planctomycetota bacterium]
MKRIAILTAGGDTPALNATLYGVVQHASELEIEVYGILEGFEGMLNPRLPHVKLNPLFTAIPELDPCVGGTIIGSSRTYIDGVHTEALSGIAGRFSRLGIEGLICIGGDGTINGMQPLSELFPCVLAPKTIDNDLGLNHIDEPNEWVREESESGKPTFRRVASRNEIELSEMINYVTPGYATAVYVAAQGIERTRTTAESHRRIAIVEVMGRDSGYIALGASYGQPDFILIPEVSLDRQQFVDRVRKIYDLQRNVIIVIGEGVRDAEGQLLGEGSGSVDPSGNVVMGGAAVQLKHILRTDLGDDYFQKNSPHDNSDQAIFTRKVGHTQRGGRPVRFDRFHAAQLGGQAVELLIHEQNNHISTVQWSPESGFTLSQISANKLRDQWGTIRPRQLHPSFYDPNRYQPSEIGREYLETIFTDAIGHEDLEVLHSRLFHPGNLLTRYQSFNIDIRKRMKFLD